VAGRLSGAPDGWIRAKNGWLDVVCSSRQLDKSQE
jgi:hypothetical protein